ncbi:MAG: helix-turn-helix domain-containing protein [Candidatus Zixiibacteriota bacterium]|nr:MAG: helix-turn-helix domain-containing protein [candidate division Zixibacteria bacterium]
MAKSHSNETKAAVMAALLQGQSVSQVAEKYKVPRGTVARWSAKLNKGEWSPVNEEKSSIGELLLKYLEASLEAMRKQVEHFGNTEWLKDQRADELAVLHGVQMDKAVRLLEALNKQDNDSAA